MTQIRQLSGWLAAFCQGVLGLCLALMSGAVLIQVILRTFFQTTWLQMEDLIPYAFSISTFLGAALVIREGGSIVITFFADYLGGRAETYIRRFAALVTVLFFLMLLYYGTRFAINGWGQYSPLLRIPVGPIYAVVPISALMTLIFLLSGKESSK